MKYVDIPICIEDEQIIPHYQTEGSSGADLYAYINEAIEIAPGASALIPTGIACEIPVGYEIQIRPRSGLALKDQITVLNTPGTIDADYRGQIQVILINHGKKSFKVEPLMRIAQMVVVEVRQACFTIVEALSATARGQGGFGSTGGK